MSKHLVLLGSAVINGVLRHKGEAVTGLSPEKEQELRALGVLGDAAEPEPQPEPQADDKPKTGKKGGK